MKLLTVICILTALLSPWVITYSKLNSRVDDVSISVQPTEQNLNLAEDLIPSPVKYSEQTRSTNLPIEKNIVVKTSASVKTTTRVVNATKPVLLNTSLSD
ncbi:hypothetical protein [Thalassotalea aquiviva]|uniref:hypothetical protein n=1 Tax=Thalassotalea aquiviva TaxID=3242415 RepID=UPI00352A613D